MHFFLIENDNELRLLVPRDSREESTSWTTWRLLSLWERSRRTWGEVVNDHSRKFRLGWVRMSRNLETLYSNSQTPEEQVAGTQAGLFAFVRRDAPTKHSLTNFL